ncbi:MAG: 16S rRNA (adenine(1518)-N(6)/adenine(1519)-N(6))-dimethyltransferase RsmA [Candidatus Staskawiczbacteria bacterium]|nr:16S rRNA (adenine(1518)-N(6)/adenine(1519)-N(6))-dimethyltransferase RsmA [Candidatus Staskawiczbacteria bacterium]
MNQHTKKFCAPHKAENVGDFSGVGVNLLSPTNIKILLNKYEAKVSKGLGQNFLIDKNVLDKIIEASDIKPNNVILEVGPGLGTLTQELARRAKKVIAVEKDKTMIEILKETLKNFNNVEIIQGDILKLNPKCYTLNPYKVVANIPYYLTSPLIRKFLESDNQPTEIILMLQKEVAQRICSKPKDMNLLAVSVQFYAEPKIVSYVSKNCFWPAPKIDSVIIKIVSTKYFRESPAFAKIFFKVVKAGFSQPRKQLGNNLSKMLKLKKTQTEKWLVENKINPSQRAETLSIDDWKNLTKTFPI